MALADSAALRAVRDWCTSVFSPMYRPGDSFTVEVNTAGYVTASSTSVRFMVPLSRAVSSDVSNVTVSGMSVILRQDGKYTHGSSASVSVTPSSISAWARDRGGGNYLTVWATMGSTTNAVNNDCVGIEGTLTVTFS